MNWSHSVDSLLDKIRLNAVYLTNRHINNHLYYKNCSAYFEVPTIILSVFSGSFSVGADPFADQRIHTNRTRHIGFHVVLGISLWCDALSRWRWFVSAKRYKS